LKDRSDEQLVSDCQSAPEGDFRAFEVLVKRYSRKVVANCRYITRSPADSEDLAQEVFVKAFSGLGRFEERAAFRTWLQRIKVNHCLNFLKSRGKRTFVDIDDPAVENTAEVSVSPTADRQLEARSELERVGQALESMADTLRIPLVMRDMDQLAYQEIADTLGVGLSAVKKRIKRGREEFRRLFDELGAEEVTG